MKITALLMKGVNNADQLTSPYQNKKLYQGGYILPDSATKRKSATAGKGVVRLNRLE